MDNWLEIWYTIKQNKLRTFLTGFSVAWGVFMLVLLLGAGSGLINGVRYAFMEDAVNSGGVWTNQVSEAHKGTKPGTRISLDDIDLQNIKTKIPKVNKISGTRGLWGDVFVKYREKVQNYQVQGVHPGFDEIEAVEVIKGRFINRFDQENARKVCLISTKIRDFFFEKDQKIIGEVLDIKGSNFVIVGVYQDQGGNNELNRLWIPMSVSRLSPMPCCNWQAFPQRKKVPFSIPSVAQAPC